jgi:hypothetical protein
MKIYFKQSLVNWLYWYTDLMDKHLTLRFSGKPSFLLEKFIKKHWTMEGQIRYQEVLELLNEVWDDWKSPFVLYVNQLNE